MDAVILVALIGAIPGIYAIILQMRKNKAEEKTIDSSITGKITDAAGIIIDKLQVQMDSMEKRIDGLMKEIVLLKKREKIFVHNQKELLRIIKELKDVMRESGIDYDVEPELMDIDTSGI